MLEDALKLTAKARRGGGFASEFFTAEADTVTLNQCSF
jgi:hypothetical protein